MNDSLRECENCHQPILIEVEGINPGLCPNCRPRRPGAPRKANPRTLRVNVRLTIPGMAHVDKARGSWSRSEYVRRALAKAAKDGLKGPR